MRAQYFFFVKPFFNWTMQIIKSDLAYKPCLFQH
jgi:hypothetical protein